MENFIAKKFWSRVEKVSNYECCNYKGPYDDKGYGKFYNGHTYIRSHRIAYELYYGPIPNNIDVCHTCDNPPCCNPIHLFLGTARENFYDSVSKGRSKWVKLDMIIAREIRMRVRHTTMKKLALEFGVSSGTISKIVHHKIWKENITTSIK